LLGDDLTVRCIDWRVSSGEERCMRAAAGDWLAVPRRGRVEEAVGVALEAVRGAGAARVRRRGMVVAEYREYRAGRAKAGESRYEGSRRRQIARPYRGLSAGMCKRVAQTWC
jgi:hypothetical protein